MPQRKSHSRKRHQFWCHRRKMAPIRSLVYQATGRWLRFGAKNKKFWEKRIKTGFLCSTPWGDLSEISEAIHKIRVFVLYHLREKNIYGKGAVFDHPRCLPIEGRKIYFFKRLNFRFFSWSTPWGRKFRSRHNFWPLQVGTSEGIFKTGVKKLASRCLLFEGRKFFENDSPNGLSQWE